MTASVVSIRGAREAPRAQQSKMDTLILSVNQVDQWRIPPFQRPVRINEKVRNVAEKIKADQVIEGVVTLGRVKGENVLYVVDGQHRLEAFRISGVSEVLADIRIVTFDSMPDMADEFVQLNSSLVRMRPDDILRGLEGSVPALATIRKTCDFVGYDMIRRSTVAPVVSMSALLRCWYAAGKDTPSATGESATNIARDMDQTSLQNLLAFLNVALAAWGRDPEYYRLWGNLNLTMCMWLWQRLVIDRDRSGNRRYAVLNAAQFKECLMSLSADSNYVAWLTGRQLSDRDRSPCYNRIKTAFSRRQKAAGEGSKWPQPAWAASRGT